MTKTTQTLTYTRLIWDKVLTGNVTEKTGFEN